ncbi:hypothetical protein EJB05_49011, partial [Eragrostis curvula]
MEHLKTHHNGMVGNLEIGARGMEVICNEVSFTQGQQDTTRTTGREDKLRYGFLGIAQIRFYSLTSGTGLGLVCPATPACSSTTYPNVEDYERTDRAVITCRLPLQTVGHAANTGNL